MELRILEFLAALLLCLSIIRPLVRNLWKLEGLAASPILALGILAGIFPAYGFRPECIPLLGFALFLVFANASDLGALFFGLQSDAYRDRGLAFTLASAAVFAFTLWITLSYAPPLDTDLSRVQTLFIRDWEDGGELCLRIYLPETENAGEVETEPKTESETDSEVSPDRPLLILIPPVAGSFTVTDALCLALRDRGFSVLSYSRPGFDSPSLDRQGMPARLFIPGLYRLGNALGRGLRDEAANAGGRELEAVRLRDVELILRELAQNKTLRDLLEGADRNTLFLAGYGAGGAALTVLAGDDGFAARYPQVRGIAAVEAPLLSSLEGEARPPAPAPPDNPPGAFFFRAGEFLGNLAPRKITRIGTVPRPVLPSLFILSGRVIRERTGRYETILRTLGAARGPALLAAVPGAGPLDYSDSPRQYPLLSALFRGAREAPPGSAAGPELTASLMANFAALILESGGGASPLVKTALPAIHLEKGGVWHIPPDRTILQP
ncbi:MAG: hypothetical protein LBD09_03465 [Treponema sp.]|jgi:hypothetical protein|nr:hypothetical protein [Treponema sp.]